MKSETPEFLTGLCHQQAVYSERGALAAPLSSVCGRICLQDFLWGWVRAGVCGVLGTVYTEYLCVSAPAGMWWRNSSSCLGFLFCLECHGSSIQVEEVAVGADTGVRLGRVGPAPPSLAVRPRPVAPLSSSSCSSSSSSYSWGEFISSGRSVGAKLDQVLAFLETASLKIQIILFCDVILLNY